MTDEILEKLRDQISQLQIMSDVLSDANIEKCKFDFRDYLDVLKALCTAIEYISDIPDWHLLMTMPPKSPKNIKLAEIAAILGVEEKK